MTDQFNKLADALESYTGDGHGYQIDDAVLREAARILRAACAADVGGLMRQAQVFADAYTEWANYPTNRLEAQHDAARAALESALRVALAGREPDKLDAQIHDSSSMHVYATVEAACWGEYTIDASRDDESRNWYITVTAPSGIRDYDGYWRNSDFKTADDVVNEAIRGACLTGLAAAQAGAQEPKP